MNKYKVKQLSNKTEAQKLFNLKIYFQKWNKNAACMFNIIQINHVLPKIVFSATFKKIPLSRKTINRVLTLCHLLDNLSITKKYAQELEICILTVRLLRAFDRNKVLRYKRINFSNFSDNSYFQIYYGRLFSNRIHMLRINPITFIQ